MNPRFLAALILVWLGLFPAAVSLPAQLPPAARRELTEINAQLTEANRLLRDKDLPGAAKILDEMDARLTAVTTTGGAPPSDPLVTRLNNVLARHRATLERERARAPADGAAPAKKPPPAGPSFVRDVAPIINSKCLTCHGEQNPRSNLRLDTFAAWRRGGRSGQLLVPGAAARSLLCLRLTAPDPSARMPLNADPLAEAELAAIANWINAGAKFDGSDESATLARLLEQREEAELNLTIPLPKGNEQVSFRRDIAPWFVNLCVGCHNANQQSGGLSIETFYDLMKGGDSGAVILPGDMESSRLFRLVGGKELPRMPNNNSRITAKNYNDLQTWFREGNTYDGGDPRAPLRSLVAAPDAAANDRFAAMSPEELRSFRREQSTEQLRKAIPNEERRLIESANFVVLGNATQTRLEQVRDWADADLAALRRQFDGPEQPWRGGLAIFVLTDRFSHGEFLETIENRRAVAEERGHFRVAADQSEAYIVLFDEAAAANALPLRGQLMRQLAGAYLQRSGRPLPAWLREGTGLMLAESVVEGRAAFNQLLSTARSLAPTVSAPDELFSDRAFSPESNAAVGYALVKFLSQSGRPAQFPQLVGELQAGRSFAEALTSVYQTNPSQLAAAFVASLRR